MKRRAYGTASTRFHLLEALRAISRVEDRGGLNARGLLAKDNILSALEKLESTKKRAKKTRVGSTDMHISIASDLPAELGSYSDGVTDDAAFHPEIIGCGMPGVAGSLSDLSVAGLPGYLFTKKNLSNAAVRRRLSANIKAMAPKTRRRVLARLREAVAVARVSGQVRNAYPSIAGSSCNVGWSGITVQGSRCPYANVAGALTP